MYFTFSLLIALRLSIDQSFVSCEGKVQLARRLNSMLTQHRQDWMRIHIQAIYQPVYVEAFYISPQVLFNDPVNVHNVEAKYFMTVMLLGCKYTGALYNFVTLIRHCLSFCRIKLASRTRGTAESSMTDAVHYKFVLEKTFESLPMFYRMSGALNYLKAMYPEGDQVEYTTKFLDCINSITDFTLQKSLLGTPQQFLDGDEDHNYAGVRADFDELSKFYNALEKKLRNNLSCNLFINFEATFNEFEEDFKMKNPNKELHEILKHAEQLILENWNDVIVNTYDRLGFCYDQDTGDTSMEITEDSEDSHGT